MARTRSAESPRTRSKTAAIEEITYGIATFQKILTSIEDFSREGFPYRDGARAKAELQIRETVRRLFGERSPEFQAHRAHKLKISTPAETTQSVLLVKSLVSALEHKKLELQGLAPAAPLPPAEQNAAPPSSPQMTLVPPAIPAAQIAITPSTPGSTPPVTMAVAITTNLSQPTAPVQITVPATTPESLETPPPVQPITPVISPGPLESAPIRAGAPEPPPAAAPIPAQTTEKTVVPACSQEPATPLASIPTASTPIATPIEIPVEAPLSPISSPLQVSSTTSTTPIGPIRQPHVEPAAPAASVAAPIASPASPSVLVNREQPPSDPLEALRKVCQRFHAVARQLRLRKDYRTTLEVEDDFDLQDLLCALLKLEFDEVGADEWTPPYTGGSTRTTLLLNRDRLAVVAKKTRSGLTTKELAEQVAADVRHYASREHCAHLFCFIYDPEGRIGSPTRLESDLTSVSDSFTVDVLIAPK